MQTEPAVAGLERGVPGVCVGPPAEVSCSAAGQPFTQPNQPGEQQLQHTSSACDPHLASTTFIPPGSSEPHPPVRQDQHLAISNQKFWKEGKACRTLCLSCCCLPLTRIIFLPEVGLTHPQHGLRLASSPLSAPQPRSEHTGFLPSQ